MEAMEAGLSWEEDACFFYASNFLKKITLANGNKPFSLRGPSAFRRDYGIVEKKLPPEEQRPKTHRPRRKPVR